MPKKVKLKTFRSHSSIITRDHEQFGLHKDISEDEALKSVIVRVIPLNWIFVNGSSLSNLFRKFRID